MKKIKSLIIATMFLMSLLIVINPVSADKSLYVIADINDSPTPIDAYGITGTTITYQHQYDVPYFSGGACALALDSDNGYLFIAYEFSSNIQVVNAQTMVSVTLLLVSGPTRGAGIVYDHENQMLYMANRYDNRIWRIAWDPVAKTLTYVDTKTLTGAYTIGIALDEQNDLLYTGGTGNSNREVAWYSTSDWSRQGSFNTDYTVDGIAVDSDPARDYVYTTHGFSSGSGRLYQYNRTTGVVQNWVDPGGRLIGVDIDNDTGMIYTTDYGVCDCVQVFNTSLVQTDSTSDIGNPTGIVVPRTSIGYDPLNLTKDDGLPEGEIAPGGTITYTLSYQNGNPNVVHNVTLEDILPIEVEFVSASDGGSYSAGEHKVTWNIGDLEVDEQGSVTVTVRVKESVPIGTTIENLAMIDSDDTGLSTESEETVVVEPSGPTFNPIFSFLSVKNYHLRQVNTCLDCITDNLPEDVPEDVQALLDEMQEHINNANKTGNSIYANNELLKALKCCEDIQGKLGITCPP